MLNLFFLAWINVILALIVIILTLIYGPFNFMAVSAFCGWILIALSTTFD